LGSSAAVTPLTRRAHVEMDVIGEIAAADSFHQRTAAGDRFELRAGHAGDLHVGRVSEPVLAVLHSSDLRVVNRAAVGVVDLDGSAGFGAELFQHIERGLLDAVHAAARCIYRTEYGSDTIKDLRYDVLVEAGVIHCHSTESTCNRDIHPGKAAIQSRIVA
jgi:hypothetical protein